MKYFFVPNCASNQFLRWAILTIKIANLASYCLFNRISCRVKKLLLRITNELRLISNWFCPSSWANPSHSAYLLNSTISHAFLRFSASFVFPLSPQKILARSAFHPISKESSMLDFNSWIMIFSTVNKFVISRLKLAILECYSIWGRIFCISIIRLCDIILRKIDSCI